MSAIYWEVDKDPVPKCKAFVRNVVHGFVSYIYISKIGVNRTKDLVIGRRRGLSLIRNE